MDVERVDRDGTKSDTGADQMGETTSAVERIRRRRSHFRAGRNRGGRIAIPGEATSPMDRNPTLVISADVIADCLAVAQERRHAASRVVVDAVMQQALRGRAAHAETA